MPRRVALSDSAPARIHVGISGWVYPKWRGVFYPKGLPQARELTFVSQHYSSVEVNGSFYGLLRPSTCERWYAETPDDFVFAVKGSRFITHMKRLRDAETPLANFFASGILALRHKLGPILWQMPASVHYDRERFETFFRLLPRSMRAAGALAARHDHRLDGRSYTRVAGEHPLRYALEVRHPSFACADCYELLAEHGVALCVADNAGKWPTFDKVTADFMYVRLHGDQELYVSGYEDEALVTWARRIRSWRGRPAKRDVYVYFDNDARVRAPFDAQTLAEKLGVRRTLETPDLEGAGEPARTHWPMWERRTGRKTGHASRTA